ncbi:hypothetical protein GW17_00025254 [Ensete ventricosum]|nr:hypothetical protein GW17_00025254 [Ensete ventricosum]RZR77485.1 hypothetical protein BHM03_00002597 [Ensete ventricosum]
MPSPVGHPCVVAGGAPSPAFFPARGDETSPRVGRKIEATNKREHIIDDICIVKVEINIPELNPETVRILVILICNCFEVDKALFPRRMFTE